MWKVTLNFYRHVAEMISDKKLFILSHNGLLCCRLRFALLRSSIIYIRDSIFNSPFDLHVAEGLIAFLN